MALVGKEIDPSAELVSNLTANEGPLQAGALPAMDAANADGEKSLAEALHSSVTKTKKAAKKRDPSEKVQPATFLELLCCISYCSPLDSWRIPEKVVQLRF